jgi:hypothetical protein
MEEANGLPTGKAISYYLQHHKVRPVYLDAR